MKDAQTGIAVRFIREWKPEPIEVEIERDMAMLRALWRWQREQFFALLNMPGAE